MKLFSSLIIYLALSACATNYVSPLSEPNYGRHALHYSEGNVDATLLMDGIYASKQMNGPDVSGSLGAFCLSAYGCSHQPQLWASGSAP
jgi:hypothetical protein